MLDNSSPHALILSGYGLNCENETLHAFEKAGAKGTIIHINDLADNPSKLLDYQIFSIPGGFSYGDDMGSGHALSQKIKGHLSDTLFEFIEKDTLTLGICNGCQTLVKLGIFSNNKNIETSIDLHANKSKNYECRWVYVKPPHNDSPWLAQIETIFIPVAHGEGQFYMEKPYGDKLKENHQIGFQYVDNEGHLVQNSYPENPNGSYLDIAGITDKTGRVLAMMPHPERAIYNYQRPDWPYLKEIHKRKQKPLPELSDGIKLFQNAVNYFK